MKYSKDEMLRDTLIGEAALELFDENGCVTFKGVLEKLDSVRRSSDSEEKVTAASRAIEEIKADMAAQGSADKSSDEHSSHESQNKDETSRN